MFTTFIAIEDWGSVLGIRNKGSEAVTQGGGDELGG